MENLKIKSKYNSKFYIFLLLLFILSINNNIDSFNTGFLSNIVTNSFFSEKIFTPSKLDFTKIHKNIQVIFNFFILTLLFIQFYMCINEYFTNTVFDECTQINNSENGIVYSFFPKKNFNANRRDLYNNDSIDNNLDHGKLEDDIVKDDIVKDDIVKDNVNDGGANDDGVNDEGANDDGANDDGVNNCVVNKNVMNDGVVNDGVVNDGVVNDGVM